MFRDNRALLRYFASRGKYFTVKSHLYEEVGPNGKDCYGNTSLILTAEKSNRELVQQLIYSGADIYCCDDACWTSLHHASSVESVEIVKYLVNQGAALDKKDFDGRTPLMVAAACSQSAVVELFINLGADIHCCDNKGWTSMHYASSLESVEIVQCLVNQGAFLDKKDFKGTTPLMVAVEQECREVAEVLINSGADIHCCDYTGLTLLHHASSEGSIETVQYLVNKGVSLDKKDIDGQTPLHIAVECEEMEIAEYLLKAGADCNLEDDDCETSFSYLIKTERPNVEIIKLSIEKGAYVMAADYSKLLENPLLKKVILQDATLCSQAVINKFNNNDLPLLYKGLASSKKLPHIDKMKIRHLSGMALGVKQTVTNGIQAKGFCNLVQMVPVVLGIFCVKSLIEKSVLTFNRANLSESQNGLKRLGYCNEQEHPCKKHCVE